MEDCEEHIAQREIPNRHFVVLATCMSCGFGSWLGNRVAKTSGRSARFILSVPSA